MPTPFAAADLVRLCDEPSLTRGRSLLRGDGVALQISGDTIIAEVRDGPRRFRARLTPRLWQKAVSFTADCSCGVGGCSHLAAAAFATLEREPAWRRAEQASFLGSLLAPAEPPRELAWLVEPGAAETLFFVTTLLEDPRSGRSVATTPARIAGAAGFPAADQALCRLIGGESTRTPIPGGEPLMVARIIDGLVASGKARWKPTGRRLIAGPRRVFEAGRVLLPPGSLVLSAGASRWYVNAQTGEVGQAALRAPPRPAPARAVSPPPPAPPRSVGSATATEAAIVERPMTPVLRFLRIEVPDENGAIRPMEAVQVICDYAGAEADAEDERQFVRLEQPGGSLFVRRDRQAELRAFSLLRDDGFTQIRVPGPGSARGRRLMLYRGRDAAERWRKFLAERVPVLEAEGVRIDLQAEGFAVPRLESAGAINLGLKDAEPGWFTLELGIEVAGERLPLLPILNRLIEQGGMAATRVVDGMVELPLGDGRIVLLPRERVARMLAVVEDLTDHARRLGQGTLLLPEAEAPALIELEGVVATDWQAAARLNAYIGRFREGVEIQAIDPPASFKGQLRPYQRLGLGWLQHLGAEGLGGILADDMGLGKTAQTIAHLVIEHEAGRLDQPALIVVPTSLVTNWTAELTRFAPHLGIEVLHGLDRHERRERLGATPIVITTYTVLARDIEAMARMEWSVVVLDEAQAIKSPQAKTTRAVCRLIARQRLCLSGTPIENNLEELWSQFAFLMPGLRGDRRAFAKRFRAPIEKRGDQQRQAQLVRRIRPFILRRTKGEVATELPPKHTILRRITLAPEQRELYETIRVTLHDRVRQEIEAHSLAGSRIVLLDALLKLRQVCCDPRLVKLDAARGVAVSSKLDDLVQMVEELISEGRRILLFSQFTSMLDLIKPVLDQIGIGYVELRGDTTDRATPVRRFEAGEVPLFLISLKAGGRGLNLVAADTVIHYDPWWNPAAEEQASDRAHRIGQTRSVFVYKLIAAGTVEERILELQDRKRALAGIALGGGEMEGLGMDEVDFLFAPAA